MSFLFDRAAAGRRSLADWIYLFHKKFHRLDFDYVSVEELGLDSDGVHHAASGGPDLSTALRSLQITRNDHFLDYGSGKGAACLTAAMFPFGSVTGVEISAALVQIAEQNAARLKMRDRVKFICKSAPAVTDIDHITHFYMYNPFGGQTLSKTFEQIVASVSRAPRRTWFIYRFADQDVNPNTLVPELFLPQKVMRFKRTHPCHIYATK